MLSDACPSSCTKYQHRFVHGAVPLLALKPPFRSKLVRILTEHLLVELHYHRIHPNLGFVNEDRSNTMLVDVPWCQA
jgi:hypothetical protein